MDSSLTELCHYYRTASRESEPLILATTIHTEGSTYRKAGARILISSDGGSSGMISGGCLETDLIERALRVLKRGAAERVRFDTTRSKDDIWGFDVGCEGISEVWLQSATPQSDYAPLPYLGKCLDHGREGAVVTVIGGQALPSELGRHGYAGSHSTDSLDQALGAVTSTQPAIKSVNYLDRMLDVFVAPVTLPTALLICGGGPDAIPVARLADSLGWRVTICDHRPAFAVPANFPATAQVILVRPQELSKRVLASNFDAAVIMSHNLAADVEYLRQLAENAPRFIGLLGPAARRARLMEGVGSAASGVSNRLYGPVGLNIGANSPASIAVSIIAQIHAVLTGHTDAKFADR